MSSPFGGSPRAGAAEYVKGGRFLLTIINEPRHIKTVITCFKVTSKVYFSIIKLVYELPLRRGQGGGFY